jgi:hypothetical protein
VARCTTVQIGRTLADSKVVTLNKAGVEGAGILGVKKCPLQFRIRAKKESAIYPNHPVLPALLDDLTENAGTDK